jgi:dihydroorotate dehydrogenase
VLYELVFKLVFSNIDPEKAHHFGMFVIKTASKLHLTKLLPKIRTNKINSLGLNFEGAFGLAAGFDKNATAVKALGELGFSHVEIGTVTAIPQPGNPAPRLFRLIQDRALINRMGFNNDGAEAVSQRLQKLRASKGKLPIIGVNIGKSKVVELENAAEDYRTSAKLLAPFADYLAVNVSSPNTPGLRDLQSVKSLKPILEAVLSESLRKPVLVKIAPDLADEDILAIAELSKQLGLAGVIATNTTIGRSGLHVSDARIDEIGAGGLSGAPISNRSLEVLQLLRKELDSSSVIISVGGVETKDQVQERLKAGANLVQGYTGFVYFGPLWARKLNRI